MSIDPGYGSALAPKGSEEWAKRWRLEFQNVASDLGRSPKVSLEFYEVGKQYRAWTLLTDGQGRNFADFDAFCACPQPYGLGIDPAKFRAYLEAEVGKRAVELETVPPGRQGERTDMEGETSGNHCPKSGASARKEKNLRAILRAPELVQELYRKGLVSQTTAAKLGPKRPTPEQAAKVAEARQAIERLDLNRPAREVRKDVDSIVSETVGLPTPSPLEAAKRAFLKLDPGDRRAFLEWAAAEAPAPGRLFA